MKGLKKQSLKILFSNFFSELSAIDVTQKQQETERKKPRLRLFPSYTHAQTFA